MNIKILFAFILLLGFATIPAFSFAPKPQPPKDYEIVVQVLGQVQKPGRYTLPTGAGVINALVAAGGYTRLATPSRVMLTRNTSTGKPDKLRIDCKRIAKGIEKDVPLRDGDIIAVPETFF